MCGLFWGAHKSLAPRARTLLGGLGQATLSFFAVATLLFVFFGGCPKFCDLAKQRRKIVGGVSGIGKDDFLLHFSLALRHFLGISFFFCCDPRPCGLKVSRLTRTCSPTDVTYAMHFTPWTHCLC